MTHSKSDISHHVKQAAESLQRNLQESERTSRGWSDLAVSDQLVHSALDECLQQLDQLDIRGEANRLPSSILWNTNKDFLIRGVLQRRAREKPRGYAGDYQMLQMICDEQCCQDALGSSFDRYFLQQAAPQAVRNRTQLVAQTIADCVQAHGDRDVRVVSIGSGPAIDVERAAIQLGPLASRLHVSLVNMDPAALEFAGNRLRGKVQQRWNEIRINLKRLARYETSLEPIRQADLIVCTGLLDYLEDDEAADFLRFLASYLQPRGLLMAFNFSHNNSSRAYMEWIGNWYLIYRSRKDMRQLADQAGFGSDVPIHCEPAEVNLYFLARPGS